VAVEDVEEFCRRVSPRLVGSLVLQWGEPAAAEDIAQEALARAWERWDQVSRMASPDGWVYRVAFNLASSHRRRAKAERRAVARLEKTAPSMRSEEDQIALRQALDALPPRQRQTIVLRYYTQLSVAQTATVMRCAPGTVKAHTSQAIAALRRSTRDDIGFQAEAEVTPDA
jgi:RNA polymerase sigma-70 factor (sigma-E family)